MQILFLLKSEANTLIGVIGAVFSAIPILQANIKKKRKQDTSSQDTPANNENHGSPFFAFLCIFS